MRAQSCASMGVLLWVGGEWWLIRGRRFEWRGRIPNAFDVGVCTDVEEYIGGEMGDSLVRYWFGREGGFWMA